MATCPPHSHLVEASTDLKRSMYGEVFTPPTLVEAMLDMLPEEAFTNPAARWLDPGAGKGQFALALFWRLDHGLASVMPDEEARRAHIIREMLFMVEVQEDNVAALRDCFGADAHVYHSDFLEWRPARPFQYVVGNPPYNSNGFKKVPTNTFSKKGDDGRTVWMPFTKHAVALLEEGGSLVFVVPSIWMRPDKANMYHFMTQHKLHRIRCMSPSETKRAFGGHAQTPTCYFRLTKSPSDGLVLLDETPFKLWSRTPIPVFGAAFVNCFVPFVAHYGAVVVKKTNMPGKGVRLSKSPSASHAYANIHTATLDRAAPRLVVTYSTAPLAYHGVPKLVLPHKMHGFPFLDRTGHYGISNRDNYVIEGYSMEALELFREFLSTKTALYLFECTRYRMRFLEKEAFHFVPDLTRLSGLARPLTDVSLSNYFGFALEPVLTLHRKEYRFAYETGASPRLPTGFAASAR